MSSAPEARASSLTAQLSGGRPRSRGAADGEASPAAFDAAPAALAASAARQAASYRLRHSASVASLADAACAAWPAAGAEEQQQQSAGEGHTRAGDAGAAPPRGVLRRHLSAPLVPVVAQLRARKLERCQHGSSSALLLMLGAGAAAEPAAPLSPASPSPLRAECDAMDVSQSPPEGGCVARARAARPRASPRLPAMSTSSERLPRRAAAPRCCATQRAAAPPRRSATYPRGGTGARRAQMPQQPGSLRLAPRALTFAARCMRALPRRRRVHFMDDDAAQPKHSAPAKSPSPKSPLDWALACGGAES
jgi:hypothetical protein